MTTKNKLFTASILSSSSIAGISLINKLIKISATSKSLLEDSQKICFHWRLGDIYYTKQGTGSPLLLIHDLNAAASSYEWQGVISFLSRNHTVYALDLLGCGRSEKPCLTYTNYLYVQLVSDFIKSEIGHRTDIIVSGSSSSFVIMACSNSPELFNRLILVNPDSIDVCSQLPGPYSRCYKRFLDFPVIGTLLYNIAVSRSAIRDSINKAFFNPKAIKKSFVDTYYEAAHLGFSPKSVYACVRCNYIQCNITHALDKINNSIYLIGGTENKSVREMFDEYTSYNPAIECSLIKNAKSFPHIERPAEFLVNVNMFLT